jgi:prefoldin subunit 1
VETTQKGKHLSQTIMQREQDIRRAALTGTELSPLPEDIGCYKGLGRSFVREPKEAIMQSLQVLMTPITYPAIPDPKP